MKMRAWLTVLLLATAVAACGSKEPSPAGTGAAAGDQPPKSAPSGNASAEQVAEEARGDVDCPAKSKMPDRASDAPVDDVVGVRPGMTYDEAANVVMCSNKLMVVSSPNTRGFNIQSYGQTLRHGFSARLAEPRVEKSSKQIMQEMQDNIMARSGNAVRYDLAPGQSKWYVSTIGMPGEGEGDRRGSGRVVRGGQKSNHGQSGRRAAEKVRSDAVHQPEQPGPAVYALDL